MSPRNLATKQGVRLSDVLVEVTLVSHEQLEVHSVLVDDHSGDLAGELLTQQTVDDWVNCVTNDLSSLVGVLHLVQGRQVKGG